MLPIVDITRFTLQDFPGHTACIVWFGGCNFRCPYCHNPEFLTRDFTVMNSQDVFAFLDTRVGLLDGVVFSGGECCLSNNIYEFAKDVKRKGFLLKIDTNGTNFSLVRRLIDDKIIDFIAIDYKAPKDKFFSITGTSLFDDFTYTLQYAIDSRISLEVRTTVHTDLLDEHDINLIIDDLDARHYVGTYYVQNFRDSNKHTLAGLPPQKRVLDRNLIEKKSFSVEFRNF